ncbi:MAG: hypothetical protein CBE21_05030, partial [Proteobacteria bacterium TMED261]
TLTGVRGAIAPFLGMALYIGVPTFSWAGIGSGVFLIAALISACAGVGFYRLFITLKKADLIDVRARTPDQT